MKIVIAASEAVPFAKTGGLADVAGTLPRELSALGHDVRLIIPRYKIVEQKNFRSERLDGKISVPMADGAVECGVSIHTDNEIKTLFIENDGFYNRDELYGNKDGDFPDNAARFTFFSKGALLALKLTGFKPDIIHVHDWQTALIPLYLKSIFKNDPLFSETSSVLTVHNIGYQGLFWHLDMPLVGVGWKYFTPEGIEFYGKINFLKAGMVYADVINTVSEKYAQEIQTPEYGFGLDGVLRARRKNLYGILNGIDTDEWNPKTDTFIVKNYGPDDLSGKIENKRALLSNFYLPEKLNVPLIGIVSRLADQKGFDILAEAAGEIMSMDLMMVILGTGERRYHNLLTRLGKEYPTKLGIKLTFEPQIAHLIEAGSDMFLMPSRYEPCGLNQMMSMRYGTIPVVRATGGLDDTVTNYSEKEGTGTGIKFGPYTPRALSSAVKKAVSLYKKREHWQKMMKNAMARDFSWKASAKKYEKLYTEALKKKL